MRNLKIRGGPSKNSFNRKDNVNPVNFTDNDPFWDLGAILSNIEQDVRNGKINDLIIIQRKKGKLHIDWRGSSPMTTSLGMLRWGEQQLLEE